MRDQFAIHNSPIVQVFMSPFSRPWVLIADFTEAYDIQTRRFKEFDKSGMTIANFRGIIPNGFVSKKAADPAFRHNKELVSHLMAATFLHQVSAPEIYRNFTFLLDLWTLKLEQGSGRPFRADQDMYMVALDIIMAVTFDHRSSDTMVMRQMRHLKNWYRQAARLHNNNNHDDAERAGEPFPFPSIPLTPDLAALVYLTESLNVAFQSPVPRLAHWLYLQKPASRQALRRKQELIRRNIDASVARLQCQQQHDSEDAHRNKNRPRKPLCALDEILLREQALASKRGMPPNFHRFAVYDEVFTYVVGGHDTSATLFNWWVKLMARSQVSQGRLREALLAAHSPAAAGRRLPTVDELLRARVPYLDAVIEETARCAHIIPITAREALVDTAVLGCEVPRGTHVFFLSSAASVLAPALGIDEARRTPGARAAKREFGAWDAGDVAEFKPERWLKRGEDGDDVFDPMAGPQMAFGGGPRGCFGKRLAILELRIVVTLLTWSFEFLEMDGSLNSFESAESSTEVPVQCYVKLRKVQW